jgi:hypothetical protein
MEDGSINKAELILCTYSYTLHHIFYINILILYYDLNCTIIITITKFIIIIIIIIIITIIIKTSEPNQYRI